MLLTHVGISKICRNTDTYLVFPHLCSLIASIDRVGIGRVAARIFPLARKHSMAIIHTLLSGSLFKLILIITNNSCQPGIVIITSSLTY